MTANWEQSKQKATGKWTRDWLFSDKVTSHATDLEEVIKNIMTLDIDKDEEKE
ncbi:hypothetical protein Tco_0885755, partial [Tanacetum coccineum]